MLAVVIQPALAMHYCQGKLSEITIPQDSSTTQTTNMMCCANKGYAQDSSLSFNNTPCCVIENIQLKTDIYNLGNIDFTTNALLSFAVQLVPIFLATLFDFDFLRNEAEQALHKYPPKGLGNEQFDILNHICIYRL